MISNHIIRSFFLRVNMILKKEGAHMKKYIAIIIPVIFFCGILIITGIGCPFRYLTGIPCAGCGMTRAWWELIHLNIAEAWSYHPLFLVPPVAFVIFLARRKIPKKIFYIMIFMLACIFIAVYVLRLMEPNDIIFIDLKRGALGRMF